MVTIKDIAKKAQVSVATVSFALNNRPEISDDTREKILRIAQEMNYRPSGSARDLKRMKTGTIGLVLSDLSGPFFSEITRAIEEVVSSNGYNLVACSSFGGGNSTAVRFLREQRTDGLLALAQDLPDSLFVEAATSSFPIILMDRTVPNSKYIWSSTVENMEGAYDMALRLIKAGYRDFCFLGGPFNSKDGSERWLGVKKALEENGLPCPPQPSLQGRFRKDGGYNAAMMLVNQKKLPELLFCANDEMAVGALDAFREHGIRVPEDISVVGFDDIELARYVSPGLTTVRQPAYRLGSIAAQMLFRALAGDASIENVSLQTEPVIRNSCLRLR